MVRKDRSSLDSEWWKQQIDAAGLTQVEAARKAGIDPTRLSRMLNGDRPWRPPLVYAMAEVLQVDAITALAKSGLAGGGAAPSDAEYPVDRGYFDALLAEKKMTRTDLAALLDVHASQISRLYAGTRTLLPEQAATVARFFHRPLTEVWRAAGVDAPEDPDTDSPVPIRGWIDGDLAVHDQAGGEAPGSDRIGDTGVALRCRIPGSGLNGMLVYFESAGEGVSADAIDAVCIVELLDGRCLWRQVKRGSRKGWWTLASPWPPHTVLEEDVELKAAWPVVLIQQGL